jgi:hypothetical protein
MVLRSGELVKGPPRSDMLIQLKLSEAGTDKAPIYSILYILTSGAE